jgi:2,3-bisphosphoglycerate-independent phosphoglycerate mutase
MMVQKVLFIICDGMGVGKPYPGNAIHLAHTPFLDKLKEKALYTELICSGEAVGLPEGQMGNSEVGHLNLGAGRVVYQDITRISKAIREGSFYTNPTLLEALNKAKVSSLHLMGLLSDGGVHSSMDHLIALIDTAYQQGVERVYLDLFLDGRDTEPRSALTYLEDIKKATNNFTKAIIATLCGRYYGMDRDKHWDRLVKSWQAIVLGQGLHSKDPFCAIQEAYDRGENDEFVQATVMLDQGKAIGLRPDDVMIFFNFRADRAREISIALTDPAFDGFDRGNAPLLNNLYCMVPYDETFSYPCLFEKVNISNTLGETLSQNGKTQLRIAETEKYAHVTFFFNGGREEPFNGEDRVLVPSPQVATFDLKPSMSANEVTKELILRHSKKYDFILLNFANLDMVGHSGNIQATIQAVETVDACLAQLVACFQSEYHIIISADHGNAEEMLTPEGNIQTAHTLNPVPLFLLLADKRSLQLRKSALLRDMADLIITLMGIKKPQSINESRLIE